MKVKVLLFASLADRVGTGTEEIEVPPPATVTDLWERLVAIHPELGEISSRPMVACDMEYAGWDRELAGVREVAFLPPVSGG